MERGGGDRPVPQEIDQGISLLGSELGGWVAQPTREGEAGHQVGVSDEHALISQYPHRRCGDEEGATRGGGWGGDRNMLYSVSDLGAGTLA